MKFSLMTYTMSPLMTKGEMDVYDVIDFAKKCGFEALEFSDGDIINEDIDKLKSLLDSKRMKTSCINGHFELAAKDDKKFENAIEEAKEMVDRANILGANCIMIVPVKQGNIDGVEDKGRALKSIANGLFEVSKYANPKGIYVTIEDFPDLSYPLGTIFELKYLVENSPGLKLTFDNGNFYPAGERMEDAYANLWKHVVNVHIKDWEDSPKQSGVKCVDGKYIRGGLHGEGLLDQKLFIELLEEKKYNGYVAFEYEGIMNHAEATIKGLEYLKSLI